MSTHIICIVPLGIVITSSRCSIYRLITHIIRVAGVISIIQYMVHLGIGLISTHGVWVCYLIFIIIIHTRDIIMSASYNFISQLSIVISLPYCIYIDYRTLPYFWKKIGLI
jgi:hypothetical protein